MMWVCGALILHRFKATAPSPETVFHRFPRISPPTLQLLRIAISVQPKRFQMETEKCQGCGELDYNAYEKSRSRWRSNDRGPRRWTATFDQLRKGEVDGCHYCRVILQGAKWAWGENPEVVGEELGHPHWRCKDYYRICPFETLYVLKIDIRPGRRLIAWRECPSQGTSSGELGGLRPNPTDVDFIEFYTPKGKLIPRASPARQPY